MWGNNMVVDISLITLDNIKDYQRKVYKRQNKSGLTKKEYQHQYYLQVTKPKRQERRTKSK